MPQRHYSGDERARLILPQLPLDDLLAELQSRLEAVRGTRDRAHALLEAVVSIGGELDLNTVLRRITEAASTLAEARYAALGVVSEEGERLAHFVTVGMTDEEIEGIGHWPHGHGILGLLIREPRPLRLRDLNDHPDAHGFPAGHPPMRTFLGMPVLVRGEVFGNLYLTEKAGGEPFAEEDEIVVAALATAAGVAIENARLYEETRWRERWLEAAAEVSTVLLSGTDPDEAIALVVRRVRGVIGAGLAAIALADDEAGELVVVAADGDSAGALRDLRVPIDRAVGGGVYTSGTPLRMTDAQERLRGTGVRLDLEVGPLLSVPLGQGASARGVLTVANPPGGTPFSDSAQRLMEAFAAQAAVALELADRRRDAERLALLEDRDRIAKDLHDTVIQQLFATAMTLMSAIKMTERPDVAARIQRSVDDLDGTIRQIRSTIFALQATAGAEESLRSRLHAVVDAAAERLGFAPTERLDGPMDTLVPEEIGEHLLAVAQEALSNIARHARATEAAVVVEIGDDLVLRVEDDGVGISGGGRRSGLRNMRERARALGGSFTAGPRPEGGTVLRWSVPLDGGAE
ncbi:GAF domain-containing protein [Spirillospora sp. NPDC029432]|uniref:sensor histidine kinase n=1 Tax=Spirillospora sp. NPDC029432 TaxID=3154599 RepID=UPI00345419B4